MNWVIACKDGSLYYTSYGYNFVHAAYTMGVKFIEFLLPFRTTCKKKKLFNLETIHQVGNFFISSISQVRKLRLRAVNILVLEFKD